MKILEGTFGSAYHKAWVILQRLFFIDSKDDFALKNLYFYFKNFYEPQIPSSTNVIEAMVPNYTSFQLHFLDVKYCQCEDFDVK